MVRPSEARAIPAKGVAITVTASSVRITSVGLITEGERASWRASVVRHSAHPATSVAEGVSVAVSSAVTLPVCGSPLGGLNWGVSALSSANNCRKGVA